MRVAAGSYGGLAEQALVAAARAGDQEAFANLAAPYGRELHVHCYRMLGSVHDAETPSRRPSSVAGATSGASRRGVRSARGSIGWPRTSA